MIFIGCNCEHCKNEFEELHNGWAIACKAFPEGIPNKIFFDTDVTKLAECANGYKYEELNR
jgi:hypothetical protein